MRRRLPMIMIDPEPATPNRYAARAKHHYELYLPARLAEIPESEWDSSRPRTPPRTTRTGIGRRYR